MYCVETVISHHMIDYVTHFSSTLARVHHRHLEARLTDLFHMLDTTIRHASLGNLGLTTGFRSLVAHADTLYLACVALRDERTPGVESALFS